MKPVTIQLGYRPLKIGFLVMENDIEGLKKVATLNTAIYGGFYNPIISVSQDNVESVHELISIF